MEASLHYYHFKEKDVATFDPIMQRSYYRFNRFSRYG